MKIVILFFSLSIVLSCCIKGVEDPAWIEINKWEMLPNSAYGVSEGELTHNFTDAWVYADGKLVGVFELPVKIPILKYGSSDLKIFPTVLNNGISATKKVYPFVQPYDITVSLVKNETVVINPTTKHYDGIQFWKEDFEEGTSIKFESDPGTSTANLVQGNDPSILKYGSYYGLIAINSVDTMYAGYTLDSSPLFLPQKGQEVYLEIDYRSTNDLITGLIEHSPSLIKYHPNIQINGQDPSTAVWKKIYIDLKEIVSGTPQAEYYKVSLISRLKESGVSGDVIIDNIKVLHY